MCTKRSREVCRNRAGFWRECWYSVYVEQMLTNQINSVVKESLDCLLFLVLLYDCGKVPYFIFNVTIMLLSSDPTGCWNAQSIKTYKIVWHLFYRRDSIKCRTVNICGISESPILLMSEYLSWKITMQKKKPSLFQSWGRYWDLFSF